MPYYVTTPIYYVNGEPHLGHVYTTVAADVLARHMRQRGEDVFFLTGTDEHGEPVAQAAEREGVPPRELAERNAERFKQVAARVGATNDFFIRTSDPEHAAVVAEVVERIKENGHVYEGTYEGWYCPRCADFKTDAELVDGNRCPIHLIELEREKEDNWFFRLSAFQEPLERLYAEHPDWVVPGNRYNEALSFIQGGLQDLSLSRARISWGVPVPWDPEQVIYVWIDALLNYYSALSYARAGEDLTDRFWPADVHLIAKDILKFHAVIWPALLMAAELPLPRKVFIHGYLLMDDHKMSKSLGNVLDPFKVMDLYGTDALRYYLLREVGFGQDGSISPEGFETRYNTELANELGNLAGRTLAMIARYRDSTVPRSEVPAELADAFDGLAETVMERASTRWRSAAPWTRSGSACARSTGSCRTRRRGSCRRTPRRRIASTRCSTARRRACAWSRCCCTRGSPSRPTACSQALGSHGPLAGERAPRRRPRWRPDRRGGPALPEGRGARALGRVGGRPGRAMVDTHCHLDSCEPPDAELVERARAAGVTRIATVGHARRVDPARGGRRQRVRRGRGHRGPPPAPQRGVRRRRPRRRSRRRPPTLSFVAVGETGLDYFRDRAPRADQLRAFEAQLDLAARRVAARGHPHARRRGGHLRACWPSAPPT